MSLKILSSNTILYCQYWRETVDFYQNTLGFATGFSFEWFVEMIITDSARVSLANQNETSIKSANGAGITLTWQVDDIERTWQELRNKGVDTGEIISHQWGARLFRFFDPEGHRLEIWSKV